MSDDLMPMVPCHSSDILSGIVADTPGVDDLWLVRFARACADGDAFCRVLAPDAFAADDLPYWMERAYLNPQTTIGPDESEYIHVTVLTFA